MSDMQLNLSGWKAVAAVVAVIGFVLFNYFSAHTSLSREGAEELKQWIAAEYQRYHLARDDLDEAQKAKLLLASTSDAIEFRSISARGTLDDMVVRVDIETSEATPPNSAKLRYYRMKYSKLNGWQHRGKTSEFNYHLAMF